MPPRRRQPQFEHLPLGQQVQIVRNLMPYPALTVMVFLRRDLGYRILNPTWLFGITVFQLIIALIVRPNNGSSLPSPLMVFAGLSFIIGMYQRFKRKRDFENRVRQHSFYLGTSILEFSWLPNFVRRNRRVARFGDPLFCFLLGTAFLFISAPLGFWLAFAGLCLRIFEDDVHKRELDHAMDIVDGLIVSENQSDVVEQFEELPTGGQSPRFDPGVSAGLNDDIRGQLKRRASAQSPTQKRRSEPTAPVEEIHPLRSQSSASVSAGLSQDVQEQIKRREVKPD
jgi:hypothetical protein